MLNIKKFYNKDFFNNSLKGMSVGFFGSLILSSIILAIFGFWAPIKELSLYYSYITPFSIGICIGYYLKLDIHESFLMAAGSTIIAWTHFGFYFLNSDFIFDSKISFILSPGDPLNIYLFCLLSYFVIINLRKINIDNWKPIIFAFLGLLLGLVYSLSISLSVSFIISGLAFLVYNGIKINVLDIFIYIIFSLSMSFFLTAPISSAAIAYSLNIQGTLFILCLISTCVNMVSFATLSFLSSKKWSNFFIIFIGTSMFQFYNSIKKPKVWIGIFITSLFSIIPVLILSKTIWSFDIYNNISSKQSLFAGMGTAAFSSIIFLISYSYQYYFIFIIIFLFCLFFPLLISTIMWKIFSKKGIIKILHYQFGGI